GGRAPAANSSGNEGKNAIILAGGMIQGGYYGDTGVAGPDADGHLYNYRAPDVTTGALKPAVTDNSSRLPGKNVWRTVIKALEVPDELCDQFSDVAGAKPLSFLLRT